MSANECHFQSSVENYLSVCVFECMYMYVNTVGQLKLHKVVIFTVNYEVLYIKKSLIPIQLSM